jgi:hypothetical protein
MDYYDRVVELLQTAPPDWRNQWGVAATLLRQKGVPEPQDRVARAVWPLRLTAGGNIAPLSRGRGVDVPDDVRREAMRALELAHKYNYGAYRFIGVARAIQLALADEIPASEVERIKNFLSRSRRFAHDVPRRGQKPSRGYLSWVVWGGDPAADWLGVDV